MIGSRPHRAAALGAAVLALVLALGLAGCSGDDASQDSATVGNAASPELSVGQDSAASGAVASGAVASGVTGYDADASKRSAAVAPSPATARIARTAEVVVTVDVLRTSAARVRAAAEAAGGSVASEVTGFGDPGARPIEPVVEPAPDIASDTVSGAAVAPARAAAGKSVLVLRVPEKQLGSVVETVARVGTEVSRSSTATDVTADLADATSRVESQRASVERVRALMGRAQQLSDVVLLEAELSRRQSELEADSARRAALTDRADLATLTVTLRTPDAAAEDGGDGFTAGLRAGWDALGASTVWLLTALGAVLPIAVLLLVVAVPLVLVRRRRRAVRP